MSLKKSQSLFAIDLSEEFANFIYSDTGYTILDILINTINSSRVDIPQEDIFNYGGFVFNNSFKLNAESDGKSSIVIGLTSTSEYLDADNLSHSDLLRICKLLLNKITLHIYTKEIDNKTSHDLSGIDEYFHIGHTESRYDSPLNYAVFNFYSSYKKEKLSQLKKRFRQIDSVFTTCYDMVKGEYAVHYYTQRSLTKSRSLFNLDEHYLGGHSILKSSISAHKLSHISCALFPSVDEDATGKYFSEAVSIYFSFVQLYNKWLALFVLFIFVFINTASITSLIIESPSSIIAILSDNIHISVLLNKCYGLIVNLLSLVAHYVSLLATMIFTFLFFIGQSVLESSLDVIYAFVFGKDRFEHVCAPIETNIVSSFLFSKLNALEEIYVTTGIIDILQLIGEFIKMNMVLAARFMCSCFISLTTRISNVIGLLFGLVISSFDVSQNSIYSSLISLAIIFWASLFIDFGWKRNFNASFNKNNYSTLSGYIQLESTISFPDDRKLLKNTYAENVKFLLVKRIIMSAFPLFLFLLISLGLMIYFIYFQIEFQVGLRNTTPLINNAHYTSFNPTLYANKIKSLCQVYFGENHFFSRNLILIPVIGYSVLRSALVGIFKKIALYLTQLESHYNRSQFERCLSIKILIFAIFNYYTPCFYFAFVLEDRKLFMTDIAVMFTTRQILGTLEEILPPILNNLKSEKVQKKLETSLATRYSKLSRINLHEEYLELCVQFSMLVAFGSFFPMAFIYAYINNVFEIKLDAVKVRNSARYFPSVDEINSIYSFWNSVFSFTGLVASVANVYLMIQMNGGEVFSELNVFLPSIFNSIQSTSQTTALGLSILVSIFTEKALCLFKVILYFSVPDVPGDCLKKQQNKISLDSIYDNINIIGWPKAGVWKEQVLLKDDSYQQGNLGLNLTPTISPTDEVELEEDVIHVLSRSLHNSLDEEDIQNTLSDYNLQSDLKEAIFKVKESPIVEDNLIDEINLDNHDEITLDNLDDDLTLNDQIKEEGIEEANDNGIYDTSIYAEAEPPSDLQLESEDVRDEVEPRKEPPSLQVSPPEYTSPIKSPNISHIPSPPRYEENTLIPPLRRYSSPLQYNGVPYSTNQQQQSTFIRQEYSPFPFQGERPWYYQQKLTQFKPIIDPVLPPTGTVIPLPMTPRPDDVMLNSKVRRSMHRRSMSMRSNVTTPSNRLLSRSDAYHCECVQ